MVESVFAKYTPKVYKHVWTATLVVDELHGGTPTDRNQIRGWIKKNLGEKNPDKLSDMVAETMVELGLSEDEAIEKVAGTVGRSAFKRSESGELFIEGRQVKARVGLAHNGGGNIGSDAAAMCVTILKT